MMPKVIDAFARSFTPAAIPDRPAPTINASLLCHEHQPLLEASANAAMPRPPVCVRNS